MNKLIIIGASGHGKVVADIAALNGYKDIVFLDDDESKDYYYDVILDEATKMNEMVQSSGWCSFCRCG